MKTFYSILQVIFNQGVGEHLSVGLLLASEGEQLFFKISEEKLDAAKMLLSEASKRLLHESIRDLKNNLGESSPTPQTTLDFFQSPFRQAAYLQYLSRYQNNLVRFSSPIEIEVPFNQELFKALCWRYVYPDPENETPRLLVSSPFEPLRSSFYPKIEKQVNTNFQLTSIVLPTLFLNTTVNLIGQNEVQVVGKEIHFEKRSYNLGKDLNDIYAMIKAFEANGQDNGKYYLIGNEPSKNEIKQHEMWETMRKSKWVEVVPTDETERIEAYLDKHHVKPYVAEKQEIED